MSKENGGSAFPITTIESSHRVGSGFQIDSKTSGGMTLRDYFAAKAMLIAPPQTAYNMKNNESHEDYISRRSYAMADAMLKARES